MPQQPTGVHPELLEPGELAEQNLLNLWNLRNPRNRERALRECEKRDGFDWGMIASIRPDVN